MAKTREQQELVQKLALPGRLKAVSSLVPAPPPPHMVAGAGAERRDAGQIELAPPTFVTLHELSRSASVDHALEAARAREPEHFSTSISRVDGGVVALWHGDAGYKDRRTDRPGPRHRLWMLGDGWRYERHQGE